MKKKLLIIALILLLTTASAITWLCYTQAGLRFALAQLNHLPKMTIKVEQISGTLAGPLHVDYFELDDEHVHVVARNIDLDLNPALLMSGWIAVRGSIDQADVALKQYPHSPNKKVINFLPGFLHLYASELTINHASFTHYNGFNIQAAPVKTRLRMSHRQLILTNLDATGDWFAAKGEFRMNGGIDLTLESQLNASLKAGRNQSLQGVVNMNGDTTELSFVADVQQPSNAHATAKLSFPDQRWLISGNATSDRWLLTPWLDNAPLSFSKGMFDYTLDEAGLHAKGSVIVPEWASVPLQVNADVQFIKHAGRHAIAVKYAQVGEKNSGINTETTGTIILGESLPTLDLQSHWSYLQWPIQAKSRETFFLSRDGSATLKGDAPWQFTMNAPLTLRNVESSSLAAAGTLATDRIVVSKLDWQVWNGTLQGSGQLAFAKPRRWQFDVQAKDINPSSLFDEIPGQASFGVRASGADINNIIDDFDVAVRNLSGVIRKQPVKGQAQLARHASQWRADNVSLRWGDTTLSAQGSTGVRNDLHWQFNAPSLQQFGIGLTGQVNMDGALQGTQQQPRLSLRVQSNSMSYEQWRTAGFSLDTNVDLGDRTASHLSLAAKELTQGKYSLSQLVVEAKGQLASHDITLRSTVNSPLTDEQQLSVDLHGRYDDEVLSKRDQSRHSEQWTAQITHFDLQNPQLHAELDHDATFSIDRNASKDLSLALHEFCVHVIDGHACATGQWHSSGAWQAQTSITRWPLALEHSTNAEVTRLTAKVDLHADMRHDIKEPLMGNARLTLSDGEIRYQVGKHDEVLPITEGTAQIDADASGVNAKAVLHIASDTIAELEAMATHAGNQEFTSWPLHGKFSVSSQDAKLIPVFVHEVDHAGGVLSANAAIAGTLGTPKLNGSIELAKGELDFYKWNLSLRDLQLKAQLNEDAIDFTATGNAGQGVLNADGRLSWRDKLNGQMHLHGDKLLIIDSPEYHVTASPSLLFDIHQDNDKGTIDVSGDVLIPSAKLQPQAIVNAVQISGDARFKDDELYARQSVWRVTSSVNVKLGEDVHFDGLGLQGQLSGEVNTRLRTGVVTSGRGELGINDGHYEAYGRKLDIKRGRLLFDNTPLDNPGLDIQAERVINDVNLGDLTVGVYVRGILRDPRLEFYSDPSMSQTQIVSYLVVGKPLDQLQSQETTTVRSATSSLAMQGGGYLAGQLGRRIGLEQVGVETDANNQSALVLGKFLSPRLFVSYGISLTQAINTLKLRYSVSKHWTLKTEAGEAKSADVEFKIER